MVAAEALAVAQVSSHEAESALIGAFLAGAGDGRLLDLLHEDDFTAPLHRVVLAAIKVVAERGLRPDPVIVLEQLRHVGALPVNTDRSPGVVLLDLLQSCPVPGSVDYYAAGVMEHTVRRRVATVGVRLAQAAQRSDYDELVYDATAALTEIVDLVARAKQVTQ